MHQAAESLDLDDAEALLPETRQWTASILARVEPYLPHKGVLDVLDVGAAQGRAIIALHEHGHRAVGVEPWAEAIAVANELGRRHDVPMSVHEGSAERLPFDDAQFDLVVATSVMEHVADLPAALSEIHRVLKPGGVFWFNSASSMSPRQSEIGGFPLFGWYPLPLKRRIMWWAVRRRPALVGHTEAPAVNWFTPWSARRSLRRAGFSEVWDRWDLFVEGERTGIGGLVAQVAKRFRPLRILGDVIVPHCSFAARKP